MDQAPNTMLKPRSAAGPIVGVVDVGSNTIKLTVARPGPHSGIEELTSAAEAVRLGTGLAATGHLAADRIDAALATLRDFAALARDHGASQLVGVATEATRRAANGAAFLRRVQDETGWDLRVISGDEEAALTFRGLATEVDLHGSVLVADIGGASTEIIEANDGTVTTARSLQLGSGTLTERLVVADPPTSAEIEACTEAATAVLDALPLAVAPRPRLIAVGGTGEYLARLVPDAHDLDESQIEAALRLCQAHPSPELAAALGIPPARARVLPAGIAIIRALVALVRPARTEVARSGIRTGLLLETFATTTPTTTRLGEGE